MQKNLPGKQSDATTTPQHSASPFEKAWVQESTPGFLISANTQMANQHRHRTVTQPGLRLIMLLEGELSLRFGQQQYRLQAAHQHHSPILLINTEEEVMFERLTEAAGRETKVCMTINEHWLEQHGLTEFGKLWTASSPQGLRQATLYHGDTNLATMARQLLMHSTGNPMLTKLEREMLSMQLLGKVIEQLHPGKQSAPSHTTKRLAKIKDLLDSGEAQDWSITQLADTANMSSSTLQRHFKREYGCNVMDYVRGIRLDKAKEALSTGQGNITAVALEAGYNSPANFATAFRRRFGISPRDSIK